MQAEQQCFILFFDNSQRLFTGPLAQIVLHAELLLTVGWKWVRDECKEGIFSQNTSFMKASNWWLHWYLVDHYPFLHNNQCNNFAASACRQFCSDMIFVYEVLEFWHGNLASIFPIISRWYIITEIGAVHIRYGPWGILHMVRIYANVSYEPSQYDQFHQ